LCSLHPTCLLIPCRRREKEESKGYFLRTRFRCRASCCCLSRRMHNNVHGWTTMCVERHCFLHCNGWVNSHWCKLRFPNHNHPPPLSFGGQSVDPSANLSRFMVTSFLPPQQKNSILFCFFILESSWFYVKTDCACLSTRIQQFTDLLKSPL